MQYHTPALLNECMEALNIHANGIYVDATFGGGGHSMEILKQLKKGKLFAFDQDEAASKNTLNNEQFIFIRQNFKYLKNYLKLHNSLPIDGLLADLGVSSHQFDTADRGFSIRFDAVLDMRMDKHTTLSAADIINTYSEEHLKRLFLEYGEIKNAYKLALTIVDARKEQKINTVNELKNTIHKCVQRGKENQYYAQVFQALRIEVNKELDTLKELLLQSVEVLKKGGRLAIISYHSLEDRLVKNFIRSGNFEGIIEKDFFGNVLTPFKLISRKPITPSVIELNNNNRVRSAKLRIAEKL